MLGAEIMLSLLWKSILGVCYAGLVTGVLGAVIMLSLLWKELRDQDLVGTAAVGVAAAFLLGHFVPLLDNRWDGSTLEDCFSRPACILV